MILSEDGDPIRGSFLREGRGVLGIVRHGVLRSRDWERAELSGSGGFGGFVDRFLGDDRLYIIVTTTVEICRP